MFFLGQNGTTLINADWLRFIEIDNEAADGQYRIRAYAEETGYDYVLGTYPTWDAGLRAFRNIAAALRKNQELMVVD